MPRRSITLAERNHLEILRVRAMFMNAGLDLDYTTAVNMALQMGLQKMQQFDQLSDEEKSGLSAYLPDDKLKGGAKPDEIEEVLNHVLLQDLEKRRKSTKDDELRN